MQFKTVLIHTKEHYLIDLYLFALSWKSLFSEGYINMFQTVSCLILDPKCIFKTAQRGNLIQIVFFSSANYTNDHFKM